MPKRQWGEASKPGPESEAAKDARRGLLSWYVQTLSLSLSVLITSSEIKARYLQMKIAI